MYKNKCSEIWKVHGERPLYIARFTLCANLITKNSYFVFTFLCGATFGVRFIGQSFG